MSRLRAVRSAFTAATACLVLATGPALAQTAKPSAGGAPAMRAAGAERIAAVVNEDVVSVSDVHARIRLALLNSGAPDSEETRKRLMPQVIRQLVDENLQLQEAKRLGVVAPQKEVDESILRIAEQNKLTRPQLEAMLKSQNIPLSTLQQQIRALVSWQRVMQRRVRQEVTISDDEIDSVMERIKANIGKPEYLVAEIFLAVDNPDQDAEVRRTAERLLEEIRRGGNFPALARQFSQSAGAAAGGDMGWVRSGELNEQLDKALAGMGPGQLSAPVRTASGYHILLVRAQRAFGSTEPAAVMMPPRPQPQPKPDIARATVNLKQIILPASSKDQLKQVQAQAEKLRKTIKGCADFEAKARETGLPEAGDMGTLNVRDLPQGLQQLVVNIPIGEPSPVLNGGAGSVILMVCKRNVPMIQPTAAEIAAANPPPPPPPRPEDVKMPPRDEIERDLMNERADLLARRYLRDLRRSAFIEVRA
ncbi:peptidylprolyl isomerase [Azospirillum sp. SYSU D00513]|uniref:peptidylprolyl isomerase n=1 Tax=Azospirillum sp. SYSU D00513 TaxID=2812561 RepID=UPI001A961398|nr:peptidylprolyl isomerase [Azospirillum sp. SYSU D00513]